MADFSLAPDSQVWVYTISDPTQVDLVIAHRGNGYENLRSSLLRVLSLLFLWRLTLYKTWQIQKVVMCAHATTNQ